MLANKSKLANAAIEFEKPLQFNGINSVTDVSVTIKNTTIHIETKAGNEFFTFVNTDGSNFSKQAYNMLVATEVKNVKVAPSIVRTKMTDSVFNDVYHSVTTYHFIMPTSFGLYGKKVIEFIYDNKNCLLVEKGVYHINSLNNKYMNIKQKWLGLGMLKIF